MKANKTLPVKHWSVESLDDQIALGKRFVQEYVELHTRKSSERYILGKYLRDCFRTNDSDYPFTIEDFIEMSNQPDCILHLKGGKRIGLELTQAVIEHLRQEEGGKLRDVPAGQSWVYQVDNQTGDIEVRCKYGHDEAGNLVVIKEEPFSGQGISGYAAELHVAGIVLQAIEKKAKKAGGWRSTVDDAQLAIVVIFAAMFFNRKPICNMVVDQLTGNGVKVPFSAVFLIHPSVEGRFTDYIAVKDGCPIAKPFAPNSLTSSASGGGSQRETTFIRRKYEARNQ